MRHMKKLKCKYILSIVFLLLIFVSATAWMCSGIEWSDDLQYMRMLGDGIRFWYSEGPFINSFTDACAAVPYHFTVGSSRLPNLVQVYFNLFPPLLVDILHGLMITVLMLMVAIAAGGKMALRSLGLIGFSALAVWVLLPWYDNMLASVYLLNYVWASVVSLIFIRLFASDDLLPKRWKPLQWMVALIVGMSHEGFALPIIVGAIFELYANKQDRRRRLMLTTLVILGAAAMFFTPGMLMRLQTQMPTHTEGDLSALIIVSWIQMLSVYVLLVVTILAIWKRGRKFVVKLYRDNLMYIGIMIAGYVIAIVSGQVRRGLWFVELVSIILALKILVEAFVWWRRTNVVIGGIAGLLTIFSIASVAKWQLRFSEEIREVCRQVTISQKPIAYVDLIDPGEVPWWTLNVTQSIAFSWGNNAYCRHYGLVDIYNILILPVRYKDTPISQWDKVAGNAEAMGQFPYYVTTQPTGGFLGVTVGGHQPAASPLDIIMSKISTEDVENRMLSVESWKYTLDTGDVIYCHNINIFGHSMRHREILSIDLYK